MSYEKTKDFYMKLGELLMFCQAIEHDAKCIYSTMLRGNYNENYESIETRSLGNVVTLLEKLDNSDDEPWLSNDDYRVLSEITQERNYWVHNGYMEYVYLDEGNKKYKVFNKQYNRLENFYNRMYKLFRIIEKKRIELCN